MRPQVSSRVRASQERQKLGHDRHAKKREFDLNDPVHVRNFAASPGELEADESAVGAKMASVRLSHLAVTAK